jgi:hypothetical protein
LIKLKYNVIIVRSLGIFLTNVGRSRQMLENSLHILQMNFRMIKIESANDISFLDSGCSNHITGNKDLFSSIDTSIQFELKLGNDCKVTVNGKGVVLVYTKNNQRRNIDDVYFVIGLK